MRDTSVKILLIEDDPDEILLIREMLSETEGADFKLEWVDRLRSGLSRLLEAKVDAILLDLSLPDSKGIETVRNICAAAPEVPIVILTGLSDESVAVEAVQEGAQDYLVKGRVDGNLLWRSVRYAIERKKMAQERENLISSLERALAEVKTLQGLIPICARCKKIRDDKGYWNVLEGYLQKHSDAKFSHSYCPECEQKIYEEFRVMELEHGEKKESTHN